MCPAIRLNICLSLKSEALIICSRWHTTLNWTSSVTAVLKIIPIFVVVVVFVGLLEGCVCFSLLLLLSFFKVFFQRQKQRLSPLGLAKNVWQEENYLPLSSLPISPPLRSLHLRWRTQQQPRPQDQRHSTLGWGLLPAPSKGQMYPPLSCSHTW